jgi:hypothetical protein
VAPGETRRTVTVVMGVIGAVALASAIALALSKSLRSPSLVRTPTPRLTLTPPPLPTPKVISENTSTPAPVPATPTQQAEPPRSAFGRQIQATADQLYSASREAEIEKLADNLNTSSVHELARTALDSRRSQNERFLSVYVIGLRASRFTKELTEIARSHLDSTNEAELAVRLQAMSALDSLAAMEPKLAKSIFQTLEREHTNPLLQKVARLGMKGAREGQPLIQKYLDMEVSEILDESN